MPSYFTASQLADPSLFVTSGYVGGEWLALSEGGKRFEVCDPATRVVIATLPDLGVARRKLR